MRLSISSTYKHHRNCTIKYTFSDGSTILWNNATGGVKEWNGCSERVLDIRISLIHEYEMEDY